MCECAKMHARGRPCLFSSVSRLPRLHSDAMVLCLTRSVYVRAGE